MRRVGIYSVLMGLYIFLGIQMLEASAEAVEAKPKEDFSKGIERIVPQYHDDEEVLLFKINFLYRSGKNEPFEPLTEGSVLQSGNFYKIIFTPTANGYVYIFQRDSDNKIYQLFPMESFGGVTVNNLNPVKKGHTYYIPAEGKSFQLDEQRGTEKLYFLASQQRDAALEKQYQKVFEEQQHQKTELETQLERIDQLLDHAMKIQGAIATPKKAEKLNWEENGQAFSVFWKHLENLCDGCVYVLTFEHK